LVVIQPPKLAQYSGRNGSTLEEFSARNSILPKEPRIADRAVAANSDCEDSAWPVKPFQSDLAIRMCIDVRGLISLWDRAKKPLRSLVRFR
jgi:hypothetical protein